jgi:hypothetical protein
MRSRFGGSGPLCLFVPRRVDCVHAEPNAFGLNVDRRHPALPHSIKIGLGLINVGHMPRERRISVGE